MPSFVTIFREKIPRHFTQVWVSLAVSLGPFAAGLGKGYSSPALASLQDSKTSSFHVSAQEGSWVASLSLLGALFGCLVGGVMLQLGRKRSLLIVALPFSGSWLLTVFAQRVEMMYSTSFIGGFFSAVTLLATQVYVSEIAHPEIRGCLSAVLKMAGEVGTLSSFTLGAFLDWRQLAMMAAGGPILFFLAILFIPETPSFLLYHGKQEEACKAMAWLRSSKDAVEQEIETLRCNILTKPKSFFPKFTSQFPFRQLFITCGLMFFQKFSGVTVFHHYAVPIFKQVFGKSIDPHGAAIVVVLVRLCGSMTSGLLIDTAGRLPLLILSNLFISGSFFGFGLYNWMAESLPPNYPGGFGPSYDWIPLTCVMFFTLFFSIGIGPISWLMVGELFPLEYRGFGGAVSTSFSYACAFAAVKTYVDIRYYVGLHGAFWIYSAISMLGLVFVCCLVPETKGVELEEMHDNYDNNAQASTNPPPFSTNDGIAAVRCPHMNCLRSHICDCDCNSSSSPSSTQTTPIPMQNGGIFRQSNYEDEPDENDLLKSYYICTPLTSYNFHALRREQAYIQPPPIHPPKPRNFQYYEYEDHPPPRPPIQHYEANYEVEVGPPPYSHYLMSKSNAYVYKNPFRINQPYEYGMINYNTPRYVIGTVV